MNSCDQCGSANPKHSLTCEACGAVDQEILAKRLAGTPGLSLIVLVLIVISIYRFWALGWDAWHGNLRVSALAAIFMGLMGLIYGEMWTFGIRRRRSAMIILGIALPTFVALNSV